MSQHHVLRASPETCHWGFFDAGLKPVLTVASGDTVTMDCVSGGPDVLPQEGKTVSAKALWEAVEQAGFKPTKLEGPTGKFTAKPSA